MSGNGREKHITVVNALIWIPTAFLNCGFNVCDSDISECVEEELAFIFPNCKVINLHLGIHNIDDDLILENPNASIID